MRIKKMNEKKKKRYGWWASYMCSCSHPIDILRAQTVFLEEDCKTKISIPHLLQRNWNSRFVVV